MSNLPQFRPLIAASSLLLAGSLSAAAAGPALATANADLQAGKADEAIRLLTEALKSDPGNAEANNLLCRVEYTLEQFDQAASHCQKAVDASPKNSEYHHWLGRAIGERASRASFISAYSLAKKTREEFARCGRMVPVVTTSWESTHQKRLPVACRMLDGSEVSVLISANRLSTSERILLQEVPSTDLFVLHGES